jgi:cyclopropane fatty-acyl-phospholipid synthase-like methyltransferase
MTATDRGAVPPADSPALCPACRAVATPEGVRLGGYELFACSRCTLRFAPQAFNVSVDYDRIYRSAEYQHEQVDALRSLDGAKLAEHPTYRPFFHRVRRVPGAKLLDVGCGVGRFGHAAFARGWDVTGIDVSEVAVTSGREFARFPMRVATIEELIEQGERFDVVTAFEVLEHLTSPVEFFSKATRLLRPGGQLFVTVPNWTCATVQNATRPDWIPPVHLLFFTDLALRRAGEVSGIGRVATGVVRADPFPRDVLHMARWLARRILRRAREPVGLWMHGQAAV